ncbi:hypothetical protein AAGW04_00605 [Pectobacterium aroidearum]
MAENNGSDATFSCVLWQKMDKGKVCQSVMVWCGASDGKYYRPG